MCDDGYVFRIRLRSLRLGSRSTLLVQKVSEFGNFESKSQSGRTIMNTLKQGVYLLGYTYRCVTLEHSKADFSANHAFDLDHGPKDTILYKIKSITDVTLRNFGFNSTNTTRVITKHIRLLRTYKFYLARNLVTLTLICNHYKIHLLYLSIKFEINSSNSS